MICSGCEAQIAKGYNYIEGTGRTPAKYLLVGEAPGATEDHEGVPFVGDSGITLRRALKELGVWEYYLTNAVRVLPGQGNPDPQMPWIRACRDGCMQETLAKVQPEVII